MIDWVLREMENWPTCQFYQKQLEAIDVASFNKLKSEGLLLYVPPNEQSESYGFQQREPLTVMKIHGNLYGVNEQDPEADPIPLSRMDLIRYRFSLERFSSMLRAANNLRGSQGPLDERLFVIGNAQVYGRKITHVLAFLDSDRTAKNTLMTLRSQLSPDTGVVAVVTPDFTVESESLRAQLARLDIYRVPIADMETLKIDISELDASLLSSPQFTLLPPEQKYQAARYGYKIEVPIFITGEQDKWNTTIVTINGLNVRLGDSPFLVFLRLFIQLLRNPNGAISKKALINGGYAKFGREDKVISELRKTLNSALKGHSAHELIESCERGAIRLSIHPQLAQYNRDKLMRHRNQKVRRLATQLL